jgi:hypothetical protein
MGRRNDDFVDHERADRALRQLLARAGEPTQLAPPPDLVTRTMRRLPAAPPAQVARVEARRRAVRLMAGVFVVGAIVALALLGLADVLNGGLRLALLFGDGGGGLSRVLLTLSLLAKPLLYTVGSVGAPLLLAGGAALIGAGWLWWRLIQRTPVYHSAEHAL